MDRISALKTVRGRIAVEFDSGRRYILKKTDLLDHPVSENMEVDEDQFARFVLLHQYPDALNVAVAMLARRACSRHEIRSKLLLRGYSEETVEMVMTKLDQQQLLDDRDFSEQWTRYRSGGSYGANRIYRELRAKGVDEETARDAVSAVDEEDQLQAAVRLAARGAQKKKPGEDICRVRQRVLQSLIRRGFDWDTARQACDRAFEGSPDDD